jgi:hypothetical protein
MGKQAGLHFVQRMQPPATFAQTHPFVPFAPFFKSPVHKAPQVVQVPFYKMTVVVFPASYQWIQQIRPGWFSQHTPQIANSFRETPMLNKLHN